MNYVIHFNLQTVLYLKLFTYEKKICVVTYLRFSTFSGQTLANSDACSGRTHVPKCSSKTRDVAHGNSYATPFTQL